MNHHGEAISHINLVRMKGSKLFCNRQNNAKPINYRHPDEQRYQNNGMS